MPTGADAPYLVDALKRWAEAQLAATSTGPQQTLFPQGYLEERPTPFSNAEDGQLFAAGALALLNLGGAAYLGSPLASVPAGVALPDELATLQLAFPLLAYVVSYVAIPALRFVRLQAANAEVERRNANRRAWLDELRRGSEALSRRLAAAKSRGKQLRLVGESRSTLTRARAS